MIRIGIEWKTQIALFKSISGTVYITKYENFKFILVATCTITIKQGIIECTNISPTNIYFDNVFPLIKAMARSYLAGFSLDKIIVEWCEESQTSEGQNCILLT